MKQLSATSHALPALAMASALYAGWSEASAGFLNPYYDSDSWMAAQSVEHGESLFSTVSTTSIPLGDLTSADWGLWESSGIQFTEMSDWLGVQAGSQDPNGWNLATTWGVDPSTHVMKTWDPRISWNMTIPANALALEVATLGPIAISVTYASGTTDLALFQHTQDPAYPAHFFGLVASESIARVSVTLGSPFDPTRSYFKSFSFGAPIPAPSIGLLFAGAVLRGARSRPRR